MKHICKTGNSQRCSLANREHTYKYTHTNVHAYSPTDATHGHLSFLCAIVGFNSTDRQQPPTATATLGARISRLKPVIVPLGQ